MRQFENCRKLGRKNGLAAALKAFVRGLWTKGTKLARYGAFLQRCKLTKKGTLVRFLPGTVCSVSLAFLHGGAFKRQFRERKTKWSPKISGLS